MIDCQVRKVAKAPQELSDPFSGAQKVLAECTRTCLRFRTPFGVNGRRSAIRKEGEGSFAVTLRLPKIW